MLENSLTAQMDTSADNIDSGQMRISVISALGQIPVRDAQIQIYSESSPDQIIEELTTDQSGLSETITLPAPPIEYSQTPESEVQPYANYNLIIRAEGYSPVTISGSELLADSTSFQPIRMEPLEVFGDERERIVIPPHTLWGEYPPKIPEAEIKPVDESGEIVLSRVVIPEYVIVHDGVPTDASAPNYWVKYTDYIKNVASSEIYSTWSENTIYANILAIMSFTLNRVYTEWYRNRGYQFTITSSTAYDQKWIYGRNTYENIDRLVDSIFSNYLSRPGVRQPIFTSYCDGQRVTCTGLSQWGSKYLGEEGYSPIEIIRFYYGSDMFINSAESISGVPSSWPGYNLTEGASGDKVRQLQQQLNRIGENYPAIPSLIADGIYGTRTSEAVRAFQRIFGLSPTGITDFATWYAISRIYVGVSRIAEP